MTRLTSKIKVIDDSTYLKHKHIFTNLYDTRQIICFLLLDKVYKEAALLYHGGIVFGKALNKPHLLVNTIVLFMIVTLFKGPILLCKMLPV